MTTSQDGARRLDTHRTIARIIALLAIGSTGCAQLQHGWRDRIGVERAKTPVAQASSPATADGPTSPDPYAARVGLDDPTSGRPWTPVEDRPIGTASGPNRIIEPIKPIEPIVIPPVLALDPVAPLSQPEDATRSDADPKELDAIDDLLLRGIARLNAMRSYQVTLERQERVRETLQAAEQVTLSVRTDPFAVRLEWPEGPSRGREVLYSDAECNGMMHVKMGKTLIPIPPMQLEPNSPIALSNSRHPITEAGLMHILVQTQEQLQASRAGDPSIGQFSRVGPIVPDEFDVSCVEVLRNTPSGEHWRLVVEEESSLPLLLEATDARGQRLERYVFRELQADLAELDEPGAFDPSVRFARPLTRSVSLGTGEE